MNDDKEGNDENSEFILLNSIKQELSPIQYNMQSKQQSTSSDDGFTKYEQSSDDEIDDCHQLLRNNTNSGIKDEKIVGNSREARNRAEKQRRDKLNFSIQELQSMVPNVANSPRRVDKTAVLRYSAHGLRLHHVFGNTNNPDKQINESSFDTFLKLMDAFVLTVTCRGQILLISNNIEQFLGHSQADLYGQSILNYIHPDDHALIRKQLLPNDLDKLLNPHRNDDNEESQPLTQEEEDRIDGTLKEDKRNFTVRFARAGSRSEPTTYEVVRISGSFRRADLAARGTKPTTFPSAYPLKRTQPRGRDDIFPIHTINGNDIVLVGMCTIIKPISICDRLIEACKYEYKTRHLIDGRIVQCDQRISIVAGYMTDEVSGLSPFTFMHKDDVRWVIVALRQMYDLNRPYGESCYRLISRNGQFIYLRTRGYLEIDEDSNKVRSFICVNTRVSEEEGMQMVKDMKKKFSVIIKANENEPLAGQQTRAERENGGDDDTATVENPQQIEKAVLNLITNLNKLSQGDGSLCGENNQLQYDNNRFEDIEDDSNDANSSVHEGSIHHSDHMERQPKSPPLALIAPKADSIKSSITKAVSVIKSATKSASPIAEKPKPLITSYPKTLNNNSNSKNISNVTAGNSRRPSVLQKSNLTISPSSSCSSLTASNQYNPDQKYNSCSSRNLLDRPLKREPNPLPSDCDYYGATMNTASPTILLPQHIKQEYCNPMSSPSDYCSNYSPSSTSSYYDSSFQQQQQQQLLLQQQQHQQFHGMSNPPLNQQQQHHLPHQNILQGGGGHHMDSSGLVGHNLYGAGLNSPPATTNTMMMNTTTKMGNDNNFYQLRQSNIMCGMSAAGLKRSSYVDDYGNDGSCIDGTNTVGKQSSTKRRMMNPNSSDHGAYYNVSDQELKTLNKDLTQVLPTTFDALGRSLDHISDATADLQTQYNSYSVFPNQQLNDIMEEQQTQREELQLLRNDFNIHQQVSGSSVSVGGGNSTLDMIQSGMQSPTAMLTFDSVVANKLNESENSSQSNSPVSATAGTSSSLPR